MHRDDLAEALSILAGESMMLAEKRHLEALQEHYRLVLEDVQKRLYEAIATLAEFSVRN